MNILITNDDGYTSKGIRVLTRIMSQFGKVTVIAPKTHQSGMSMALSMGLRPIAHKDLGEKDGASWAYIDGTPASCVKFGFNTVFLEHRPDVVVSGINHGSNAATASCYSGTLGAAAEAALYGVPAIGVSLCSFSVDADFSAVEEMFPGIFREIMSSLPERHGIYYNVNFPGIAKDKIKGIKVGHQGMGTWVKEYQPWDPDILKAYGITPEMLGSSSNATKEEGEELYVMVGEFADDPANDNLADHRIIEDGYVSVVAHNIDCTDYREIERLKGLGIEKEF